MNLTLSESFTNSAATGSGTATGSSTQNAVTSLANASIVYDAAARSYAITVDGRSQTFLQQHLTSSTAAWVFERVNGTTADTLTLTKPGTSGPFAYEYVGGAYWQHTTTSPTQIGVTLDAIAYGVETPDASLPRTGSAQFGVDFLALEAVVGNIFAISGSGLAQVDFGRGVVVTHGTSAGALSSSAGFSSEARISSTTNNFLGNFRFTDVQSFTGELQGKFFGPSAQEFGAAFHAKDSIGEAVVGTLTGRGSAYSATNASVKTPTVNQFFTADAAKLSATIAGSSGTNITGPTFTSTGATADALIVNYDASNNAYTLIAPDRSQYFLGSVSSGLTTENLVNTTPTTNLSGVPYATFTNLNSVATRKWFKEERLSPTQYSIEPLVYGIPTTNAALPRTGTGDYVIGVAATAADRDYINLMDITGFGILNADFAAGSLTLSGQVNYLENYVISGFRPREQASGTFSGNASISSSANSFSGSINLDGIGSYTGAMNGRFFGASAGEVGGVFRASDGAGGSLVGSFAGGLDAAAAPGGVTLSNMSNQTDLPFSVTHFAGGGTLLPDISWVSYDPATATYSLTFSSSGTASLNSATRDTGASNASYDVFNVTMGPQPYIMSLLKPGSSNPSIDLTYTSLGSVVRAGTLTLDQQSDRQHFAYGLRTTIGQMPTTGTATYTGIAAGTGKIQNFSLSQLAYYNLAGTTSMTANFATGAFTSNLTLTGTELGGSPTYTFAPYNFSGTITQNHFAVPGSGPLRYQGNFHGPGAQEIGGTFEISDFVAGESFLLKGAFGAKR